MKASALGTDPVPGEDSQFDGLKDALSESRLDLKATKTSISEQEAALETFETLNAESSNSRAIQMPENEQAELSAIEIRLPRLDSEHKTLERQTDEWQRIVKLLDEQIATIELGQVAAPLLDDGTPQATEPLLKLASGN